MGSIPWYFFEVFPGQETPNPHELLIYQLLVQTCGKEHSLEKVYQWKEYVREFSLPL